MSTSPYLRYSRYILILLEPVVKSIKNRSFQNKKPWNNGTLEEWVYLEKTLTQISHPVEFMPTRLKCPRSTVLEISPTLSGVYPCFFTFGSMPPPLVLYLTILDFKCIL
jgi:hypothetical protein